AVGTYHARRLLLCSGAWLGTLLGGCAVPLTVERQVMFWFAPQQHAADFDANRCPIYAIEDAPDRMFYGFPDLGDGIKVARHHEGEAADPDHLRRTVTAQEIAAMRQLLQRFLPDADGTLRSSAVCMYTNTPDEHFLVDFHPRYPQVLIASPCSGHGFKFSAAIGEVLADLLTDAPCAFDLSPFRIARFAPAR